MPKIAVKENNSYEYMLTKSLEYLESVDKEILIDLVKEVLSKEEIDEKVRECFGKAIEKTCGKEKKHYQQEILMFVQKF